MQENIISKLIRSFTTSNLRAYPELFLSAWICLLHILFNLIYDFNTADDVFFILEMVLDI